VAAGNILRVIYSNDYAESGDAVQSRCEELGCPPFHLVTVSKAGWARNLPPWPSEPVAATNDHFDGNAPEYDDMETAITESRDGTFLWKQSNPIAVGDTAYLHVAAPVSRSAAVSCTTRSRFEQSAAMQLSEISDKQTLLRLVTFHSGAER